MDTVRLLFAAENNGIAERIASALADAGYRPSLDGGQAGAALVIWSRAAAASPAILAAARAALARRVLVPVALGKAPPPPSFEHLWPMDIAGWDGAADDPRWRFVLDEVELALRRGVELPLAAASAPLAPQAAFVARRPAPPADDDMFAETPVIPGGRAAPTPHVPRMAVAGIIAAFALVAGGVGLAVAASMRPARVAAPAPVIAFVAADNQPAEEIATAAQPDADAPADALRDIAPETIAPATVAAADGAAAGADTPPAEETAAPAPAVVASAPGAIEDALAPRLKPEGETAAPTTAEATDVIAELAWTSTAEAAETASFGRYLRDCLDCPDMAEIDPGTLVPDADDGLAAPLSLGRRIAVAVRETTAEEWGLCVADGACAAIQSGAAGKQPVVNATYADAEAYAAWLSQKTGRDYRLPTETEWEYAARAGSLDVYSSGPAISAALANFGDARGRPAPSGSFAPNRFGLYDMHGNVAEWTADCWSGDDEATFVASFCSARVVKGGAFDDAAEDIAASARGGAPSSARRADVGFRLVREMD